MGHSRRCSLTTGLFEITGSSPPHSFPTTRHQPRSVNSKQLHQPLPAGSSKKYIPYASCRPIQFNQKSKRVHLLAYDSLSPTGHVWRSIQNGRLPNTCGDPVPLARKASCAASWVVDIPANLPSSQRFDLGPQPCPRRTTPLNRQVPPQPRQKAKIAMLDAIATANARFF